MLAGARQSERRQAPAATFFRPPVSRHTVALIDVMIPILLLRHVVVLLMPWAQPRPAASGRGKTFRHQLTQSQDVTPSHNRYKNREAFKNVMFCAGRR